MYSKQIHIQTEGTQLDVFFQCFGETVILVMVMSIKLIYINIYI